MKQLNDLMGKMVVDKITNLSGRVITTQTQITGEEYVLITTRDNVGQPIEWWVNIKRIVEITEGE